MATVPIKQSQYLRCLRCGKTQKAKENQLCSRCQASLHKRKPQSIQKSWAYLITAIVLLFPANLLPISLLTKQGKDIPDTIYSGIISLVNQDMVPIAIIVFVASIVVPIAKIIGLSWILIAIKLQLAVSPYKQMIMFRIIDWIGRWSILDLFVIAIMMTLLDRGLLLSFVPGPAASSFALVVVFTLLAARSFDTRLIWDNTSAKNAHGINESELSTE